jgi:hypothetical protein
MLQALKTAELAPVLYIQTHSAFCGLPEALPPNSTLPEDESDVQPTLATRQQ